MGTVATVVLDDVDITDLVIEGSVTKRLNRVSTATVKVQMQIADRYGTYPYPGAGSYLKVYFSNTFLGTTPVLWHHGRVLTCETTADVDTGYIVFNSSDPLELWQWRPVRDDDGDFSNPTIIDDFLSAPQIVEAMLQNSNNQIPAFNNAADTEGPTRLDPIGFATGGVSMKTTPVDWPMSMAQLATLLVSTGSLDIVITPIEFDADDNYGQIECFNGDYGTDLTSTVAFQYGMGQYNVRSLRWSEDMTKMCNKLWYYLGPKCDLQHWQANITGSAGTQFPIVGVNIGTFKFTVTGDATGLIAGDMIIITGSTGNDGTYTVIGSVFSSPNTEVEVFEVISSAVADGFIQSDFWTVCSTDPTSQAQWIGWHNGVVAATGSDLGQTPGTSRYQYDVRMDIKIFDAFGNATDCGPSALGINDFCMQKKNWLTEAWLRQQPLELVHITPRRDTAIGEFDIGDLVLVEANSDVKGGFSGAQRVYEYTIAWDAEESTPAIGELQVSSDNEGFGI